MTQIAMDQAFTNQKPTAKFYDQLADAMIAHRMTETRNPLPNGGGTYEVQNRRKVTRTFIKRNPGLTASQIAEKRGQTPELVARDCKALMQENRISGEKRKHKAKQGGFYMTYIYWVEKPAGREWA